jgi:hypothetical protein
LHWVLDVGFREDNCRIRKDNPPQNFAILRHISLNLLNQEKTSKTGAKNNRIRAGWDDDYLTKILAVSVNSILVNNSLLTIIQLSNIGCKLFIVSKMAASKNHH